MDSIQHKTKELLTYHCGCHGNLVTIAMRYVIDASPPIEATYQIWSQYNLRQRSYKVKLFDSQKRSTCFGPVTKQKQNPSLPTTDSLFFFLSLDVSFKTKFFNWCFDSLVLGPFGLWTLSEKKLISDDICVELVTILPVSMAASLF